MYFLPEIHDDEPTALNNEIKAMGSSASCTPERIEESIKKNKTVRVLKDKGCYVSHLLSLCSQHLCHGSFSNCSEAQSMITGC